MPNKNHTQTHFSTKDKDKHLHSYLKDLSKNCCQNRILLTLYIVYLKENDLKLGVCFFAIGMSSKKGVMGSWDVHSGFEAVWALFDIHVIFPIFTACCASLVVRVAFCRSGDPSSNPYKASHFFQISNTSSSQRTADLLGLVAKNKENCV